MARHSQEVYEHVVILLIIVTIRTLSLGVLDGGGGGRPLCLTSILIHDNVPYRYFSNYINIPQMRAAICRLSWQLVATEQSVTPDSSESLQLGC